MEFDLAVIAIELVLGCLVGFTIGLTGVGGGVLLMPALTVILDMQPTLAVGTASTYAALTKVFAVSEHWRLRTVELRAATILLIGALPGVIIAGLFVTNHAEEAGFQLKLGWFIACVIVASGLLMAYNAIRRRKDAGSGEAPRNKPMSRARQIGALAPALLIGVLLASTSTGGAIVVIPVLVFWFGLSMARCIGTSIFISLVLLVVTGLTYMLGGSGGNVDIEAALWMWLGSLAGVRAGSRLTTQLSESALSVAVVVLIFVSAGAMIGKLVVSG